MFVPVEITRNVKPVDTLKKLINLADHREFLCVAYLTLLGRLPDQPGYCHYLKLIEMGVSRNDVVAQIGTSAEARRFSANLPGLKHLILQYKLKKIFKFSRTQPDFVLLGDGTTHEVVKHESDITGYDRVCMRANFVTSEAYWGNVADRQRGVAGAKVWFDLTTSLEWTGGVVGIIRAELEVAAGLKKSHPEIRFVTLLGNGFVEIPHDQLEWLFSAENVAESYLQFFARHSGDTHQPGLVELSIPNDQALYHPFMPGDVVIAMGWIGSEKEVYYSKVKKSIKDFYISYLIYDTILLNDETRRFYPDDGKERFDKYVKWVSEHADVILYGGTTAKNDTERLQRERGWPVRPGCPVQFGTDIVKLSTAGEEETVLRKLGITGDFIITVGSLEPRKNHDTLYRAYLYALEHGETDLPQLVICGKPMWRVADLVGFIDRDPRVKGKIIRLTPTDQELALLYKRCLFTALPSLYEGWSLTLPESLGQGKFCLATDTPPLREIGGELVDFIDGWDPKGWAEHILRYARNKELLKHKEQKIGELWPETTWLSAAESIYANVVSYVEKHSPRELDPEIWIDLTTSYLHWRGGISGIIRAELTFARYIYSLTPNVHFFAYDSGNFFEIDKSYLLWLLNDLDLAEQYAMFQSFWASHESAGTGNRNPFAFGVYPGHPSILQSFPTEAIFLFLAIDSDGTGNLGRIKRIAEISKHVPKLFLSQMIYDFTPMLFPHLHNEGTCTGYQPFIDFLYQNFDFLVFGGKTAMEDGEAFRATFGWKLPQTDFIEFGSDVGNKNILPDPSRDKAILKELGVGRDFVMTVGTIEPRKNHEMLYKAFLTLRKRGFKKIPQLVIVGKPGWKTEDFRAILDADDRVKDLILVISPNDEELDVLYRNCLFTLLPSFYEGWSLTLPESLSYGKFCLVSDVAPLRETGRDLVEYIDPLDTIAWADRIAHYVDNPKALSVWEARIRSEWHAKSWKACSQELLTQLFAAYRQKYDLGAGNG